MAGDQPAAVYGVPLKGMRQAFAETLIEIGQADERVVVIDCETGLPTHAFQFARAFPERFVQLGVAEQNAISFAAGLATTGLVPILPLFACFGTRRANDQIYTQVAYPRFNVKLMGCYAGLTSPNTGATHQMLQDVTYMRTLPNMTVIEAADEHELRLALPAAVAAQGPVYFRMVRGDVAGIKPIPWPADHRFQIGKAVVLRPGKDVTLIGSGLMLSRCLEAAEALAERGLQAEVINVSTIKPLDVATIEDSARRTGRVVVAENHTVIGGLGSAVAEALVQRFPVPMRLVGVEDRFGDSGPLEDLLEEYGLTTGRVLNAAEELL